MPLVNPNILKGLKSTFQYLVILSVTAGLLWISLRSIETDPGQSTSEFLWMTWSSSNKFYLLIMFLVSMFSHLLRALRWKMLLAPAGYSTSTSSSFLSLMIGYLVNLVIPRGGEVSRSLNLWKLEKVPAEVSFGTVVTERLVDVICLLSLVAFSFWMEWDKLKEFLNHKFTGWDLMEKASWAWVVIPAVGILLLVVIWKALRRNQKFQSLVRGFQSGLFTIFKMNNYGLFLFYSLAIWFLYFLTTYWVIKAFDQTAHLGMDAVFTVFALGSVAMAVPLPGGTGSYHTLVPLGLVSLYGLAQSDAVALVFIFHALQTLILIAAGVISMIISLWLIRSRMTK
ncbi:MAG: hypothetical protein RL161_985 [Bacteroidota bacterium]